MEKNRAIRRFIIILVVVMMLGILVIGNVTAQGPGGPKTIAGRVYTSKGKNPEPGRYNGTYAAVIVEHNGVKTTYVDPDGLEQDENETYWYGVDIPAGAWEPGDTYWIKVDGTGWGDMDFTCSDHHNSNVNSWKMDATGSEGRDVDTADYNFKPIIAWIFAIILGVMGIVIGILRPLKIPFSGWPRRSADLVDEIMIGGAAELPKEAPEEGVVPPEQPICNTCGGNFEYIPEYGSWYCYTCEKYEEGEGEVPPPMPGKPPSPQPGPLSPPPGGA